MSIKAPLCPYIVARVPGLTELASSVNVIPGVRVRGDLVYVPHHAIPLLDTVLRSLYLNVESAKWVNPREADPTWARVDVDLRAAGEVREWVLDGFLTEYQREALIYGYHRVGVHFWHTTGAGKTLTAILYALLRPGPVVVVTRAASRIQYGREVERFTNLRPYVIRPAATMKKNALTLDEYMSDTSSRRVVVVGWEALGNVIEPLLKIRPSTVVYDECFVAGTRVSTPTGQRAIESLRVGDEVFSFNQRTQSQEVKKVVRVYQNSITVDKPLICVQHDKGQFVCTANHKIWTEDGYVEAGRLKAGTELWHLPEFTSGKKVRRSLLLKGVHGQGDVFAPACDGESAVRTVRSIIRNAETRRQSVLRQKLFRKMARGTAGHEAHHERRGEESASFVSVESSAQAEGRSGNHTRPNAQQQSDGIGRHTRGSEQAIAGDGAQTQGTRRERQRFDYTAKNAGRAARLAYRIDRNPNTGDSCSRGHASEMVLAGRLQRNGDDCDRSGRQFTPSEGSSNGGRSKGRVLGTSRVASVTVLEPSDFGRFRSSRSGNRTVYDLEVEDNHNYFAESILVSNCHKSKGHKRYDVVPLAEVEDPQQIIDQAAEARARGGFISEKPEGRVMLVPVENIAANAARLARVANRRVLTTATPIKDRVRDLWSQLDLAEPDAWGSATAWMDRHTARKPGVYGGYDTSGSSNLDELAERLQHVVHKVDYRVTHRSLPPKRRQSVYVAPEDQCKPSGGFQKELIEAAKRGPSALLEANLALAASKKRKAVIGLVEDHLYAGQKVIIFTGRRRDCEELGKAFKDTKAQVWASHGGDSTATRQQVVDDYMSHPGPCLLVGTGDAFGEALNLHDTDALLFVMLPWTPGQVRQWEGRVARLGQKRPVTIYYVVAEGTVDEHVADKLISKLPAVEEVSGDTELAEAGSFIAGTEDEEKLTLSILDKLARMGGESGEDDE
jgi:superfamily II DNA or RNA helicase